MEASVASFTSIEWRMKKPRDVVKLRCWCIRRRGEGASVSKICTAAQIPRRTFYDWWSRYRQHGPDGLDTEIQETTYHPSHLRPSSEGRSIATQTEDKLVSHTR